MQGLIPFKHDALRPHGTRPFGWEMERFFDRVLGDVWGQPASSAVQALRLELSETEDRVLVRAEVPGVDPKDLSIELTGDLLTISGEKKEETSDTTGTCHYTERRFGAFQRSVQLPCAVDAATVKATQSHGVVTIEMQKAESVRSRRIQVEGA